jgi:hypothetical protein
LEPIKPNFDWYSTISSQKNLPPRCPYANVERCPHYYANLSSLGSAGIITSIQPSEEKRLSKKWRKSKLGPKVNEHSPSVGLGSKNFSHFCPEVSYDFFGLFASELHRYADEIDTHTEHVQLAKNGISANDWRWQWAYITPLHYSECHLYSLLLSKNTGSTDKIDVKEIFEAKLGAYGITINIKEIAKRIWKWVCFRRHA